MQLIKPSQLRSLGIVGMNDRNCRLIGRYNPRKNFPVVDNKLRTKRLCESAGIAVPRLLGTVETQHDVSTVHERLADLEQFVLKPAQGSGGKGILVIEHRDGDVFFKPSGSVVDFEGIRHHVSNTLSGLYSLGGRNDVVMIEALVQFDEIFADYSYQGIPDIRVIVFQGYPVMSMLRLATRASDGKANLHQGAVGVGLDIGSGRALHAVQFGRPKQKHPDTRRPLKEINVPDWQRILELSAACYEITGLGYLGVDIVLDRDRGPLIIELNARPGLAIQVANRTGLAPRIKRIENEKSERDATERSVFSREAFAA